MKKCLSEASSKTRAEGDKREEKKLREAEPLKNASEPRRSGRSPLGSAEASLKHLACPRELDEVPVETEDTFEPSGGFLLGMKGVLNTLSSAGPPQQKTQNFIPVQAPLPFFSKMCAFTLSPHPHGTNRRISILGAGRVPNSHFFQVFFQHSPRTPKNRRNFAPRSILGPTWPF